MSDCVLFDYFTFSNNTASQKRKIDSQFYSNQDVKRYNATNSSL